MMSQLNFTPISIETSGQITAKQQNTKLELQQLAYPFVRTFSIMCADNSLSVIAIEQVRNHRKIKCIKNIFENGRREGAYPSSYPPGSAPGHKLQKA